MSTTAVVAIVRYPNQPLNIFTVFIEWAGIQALKNLEVEGVFQILRAYEYDKVKEPAFITTLAQTTSRYQNDRKSRVTTNLKASLAAIDNVLVPIYKK